MKVLRVVKAPLVAGICLGLVVPISAAQPSDVPKAAHQPSVEMTEAILDGQSGLQGVVVDVQGALQAGVKVVLVQQKRAVAHAVSDRHGRFRLSGLRGGVYMLQAGGQGRFVRVWTAKAAPPGAKSMVLMVTGDGVVRGQMPLEDFFASDAVVITGLVAAVIAIPVVISNQGGDATPASP